MFEYFVFEIFAFFEYMLLFEIFIEMENDASRKI